MVNHSTYSLKIVSPEKILLEADVESIIAPGIVGYLGVLANHAPLLTTLDKGTLTVRDAQKETHAYDVDGGILEVSQEGVVILADKIESQ